MYLCTLLYSKENLFTRVWKKAIFKPFNLPLLSDIVFYTYHCFILLVLVLVICSIQSRSSEVLTPKNTFRSGRKGRSGMKVAQIHWTCTLLKYSFLLYSYHFSYSKVEVWHFFVIHSSILSCSSKERTSLRVLSSNQRGPLIGLNTAGCSRMVSISTSRFAWQNIWNSVGL